MWLMMAHTLPVASQPLNALQPLLVVVMSPQVVQVPVIARQSNDDDDEPSSKQSLAARWVSVRTRPATMMG